MEFRQLEAFRAIATLGSFSAAAQKLHATQPAISSRLRALEDELGTELFDRKSRPARLTVMGHRLLHHVDRVFAATNDIHRIVGGASRHIETARIGIPSALVSKWAAHLMASIYKINPQAKVELHIDRSTILRQMLETGEIDFALIIGPIDEPKLVSTLIARYDYCWIANKQICMTGKLMSVEDIKGLIFTYSKDSLVFRSLSDYLKKKGIANVELGGSNSTDAVLHVVSKGLGIGVVMTVAIEADSLNTHGICKLDLETEMIPDSEYWATYRRDGDVLLGEYLVSACLEVLPPRLTGPKLFDLK